MCFLLIIEENNMAIDGQLVRVKLGSGGSPETFAVVAGAREDNFTLNNGEIDITDKDNKPWRTLLEGGIQSMSMSCSGILEGTQLVDVALGQTINNYQFDIDSVGTFSGSFQIRSFEITGSHEESATFTASFESSGELTFDEAE
jgi:TP901-1 family phage major tail protein